MTSSAEVKAQKLYAECETELRGLTCDIPDCAEVAEAKKSAADFDGCVALGKALSRQLSYCEAVDGIVEDECQMNYALVYWNVPSVGEK